MNYKFQKILIVLEAVEFYRTKSNAANVLWGPWNYIINVTSSDSFR